jgi:acylphosphatase
MAEHVRAHLFVSGRVQGVFYRADCTQEAKRLGVSGWVRNLDDGRVEVVAEGPRAQVERLIEWCRTGSPMAKVESVEANWEEPTGEFEGFRITYS